MKTEPTLIKVPLLAVLLFLEWLLVAHESGSPRGLSERTMIRPGSNSAHIDRGPSRISPELVQRVEGATTGVVADQLDRGPMPKPPKLPREIGSPRALSQRGVTIPGTTQDYLDRGPTRMSPKLLQQQSVRMSGSAPDRIPRGPMRQPPKLMPL